MRAVTASSQYGVGSGSGRNDSLAVTAADPDNSYAHVVTANLFSALHKDAEAMRAYDKAIALKPKAYFYLNRSLRRPKTDIAGRRADLDAALNLEPDLTEAIAEETTLQADSDDLPGAISTYSSTLAKSSDDVTLLMVLWGVASLILGRVIRSMPTPTFRGQEARLPNR